MEDLQEEDNDHNQQPYNNTLMLTDENISHIPQQSFALVLLSSTTLRFAGPDGLTYVVQKL